MRLSESDLHSGMLVHVQIIPPLSQTTVNKNMDVHVEYTYNNEKCVLNIPNTETINELKIRIKNQYEDRDMIDFKLYNENKEELSLIDPDRTLKSFGVKSGQTISAVFRLITRNTQPPVVNNHSEVSTKPSASPTTKKRSEKVIVICNYPPNNSEPMHVSLKDTVSQLTKKIETKTLNQRLVISEMSSNNIKINLKNDTFRSLAHLGFKSDDIINVTMTDKAPTYASIVSSQPPSSPKSDKKSLTHRINKKPVGLDNLGNSCYMNSALQCLAHIPQLTNFFLDSLNYHHMDDGEHTDNDWNPFDKVGEVTGAYADLLWKLWRCEENDESYDSLKPNRIKKKIGDKDSRFSTNDQQDAQEFMSFFLDAIHEELKSKNQNDRNTIIKQLFFGEITSIITCTACNKEESTTHPISFLSIPLNRQERTFWVSFIPKKGQSEEAYVVAPISGRVEHVVDEFTRCRKQPSLFNYILAMLPDGEIDFDKSLSEIPTDEIIFMEQEERTNNPKPKPLEFPTKRSTLEDCLEEFFSPEELQDGWTCQREKCKKKTTATKQLRLNKLPAVLIIQFKRFSHENGLHQKVETFVHYPMKELNLKRFLPRSSSEEAVYDLIAVSTHMGSISGGHYTAYARNTKFNKTAWYRFDDSSVTLVKEQDYEYDIVTRHAYLLFYIKKGISNQVTTV
jgi:ubiquitin C-terminal hydrolase